MKQFEIKTLNKALMLTIAIPFAIVYIFAIILYVIDRVEGESSLVFTFIVAMIPLVLIIAGLSKICKKKCTVECSDTEITLRRNGLIEKSIMYNDIMLVSQSSQNQSSTTLSFFTRGHVKPDLELLQVNDALAMRDILNIVLASNTYVETQRMAKNNQMFKEYINQSMVNSEATTIATIKSGKVQTKQTKVILIAVFGFFIIVPIIAIFVANGTGNNDSYKFESDAVYYNDKKLDVNTKEVDQLNFNLIKDSSHVYYKGEILDWADSKTFENLQSVFYSDKNGVYYETSNMFSKNQILPLVGEYDHATFQSLGHLYYKDKNNLYKLDFSIAKLDDNPLEKIEVEGLDIASFEGVGESALYWFKDKNRVYFASEKKLKPANDIDAQTFEVVTWEVAKDKNHVYYLTKDLKSDEHTATDHADYAILEGADAATFEKVGYNEFKDKDMDWTIER